MNYKSESIDERARLEALREIGVLDTPPEQAFDDLTKLAAKICEAPISLITLVDEDRQWFKSELGLNIKETSRTISFCSHAIEQPEILIVPDATKDERFARNPMVTDDPNIRFYAGAPLVTSEGHALGTLCVIDRKPREMKPEHQQALRILSRHVITLLDLRQRNRELARTRTRLAVEKEARAQAEEEFETLAETVPHIIWAARPDGTLDYFNQRCLDYFQLDSEAMRDWDGRGAVHPKDRDEGFARWQRSLQTGEPYDVELRLRRATDGAWRWHLVRAMPQKDENGRIVRWFGTCTDIQDKKEAEAALLQATSQLDRRVRERTTDLMAANERLLREVKERRASEERFRQLAENIREVFWMTDPDKQQMLYVSPAYELIWGRTVESLSKSPQKWIESIHPKDRERVKDGLYRQASGDYDLEYQIIRPDGEVRWIHDRAFPVRDADGKVYRIAGVAEDITGRKAFEETLRRERNLSNEIINSLPGIFYLFDESGRYMRWNKNLETVTGYSAEEIQAMHPIDLFRGSDKQLIAERIGTVFETGQAAAEANLATKDGRRIPFYFTGWRIEYDGRSSLIGMGIDVSERRRLEEDLRQMQKLDSIGRLAAGVAHDFNNILTVQQGYTSFLISEQNLPSGLLDPLREIHKACERGASLVRQLLLFSRKEVMQKRHININEMVATFSRMLERLLGEEISIDVRCSVDVPHVTGDPGMLEQVIMNLAVNARDAMPEGGNLTLSTSRLTLGQSETSLKPEARTGVFVCICVEDSGSGMTPETIAQAFEPFFTTKEPGKGTGLGLSSVYGIVKEHGGWIDVESTPGVGTCVKVHLPADTGRTPGAEQTTIAGKTSRGSETILVVEDEPSVREMVSLMLASSGYRVLTADSGVAALEVWRKDSDCIDLLLTDMVMPHGMSGIDLAERLWQENPKLKVVFTSGYSHEIALTKGLTGGKSVFLQKPYASLKLNRMVRDLLDEKSCD